MWVFRALLVVVLIAVLLGFSVYNAGERVTVRLLNTPHYGVPLIYVAYWAFLFGMVISFLLFVTIYFKQASEIRRHKRLTESLNNEISALRNRSIEGSSEIFHGSKKDDAK